MSAFVAAQFYGLRLYARLAVDKLSVSMFRCFGSLCQARYGYNSLKSCWFVSDEKLMLSCCAARDTHSFHGLISDHYYPQGLMHFSANSV